MGGLSLWAALGWSGALFAAAAGVGILVAGRLLLRNVTWTLGIVVALLGVTAAFWVDHRAAETVNGWEAYWNSRSEWLEDEFRERLSDRVAGAYEAAVVLHEMPELRSGPVSTDAAAPLRTLRSEAGLAALALYSSTANLLAWDGVHRGQVPPEVQGGLNLYSYLDQPLFAYLHVAAITGSGETAVAALLIRTDLSPALVARPGDFTTEFARDVGERVSVTRPGISGETTFDVTLGDVRVPMTRPGSGPAEPVAEGAVEGTVLTSLPDDSVLFSVTIDEPVPNERAARLLDPWRLRIAVMALLAWMLLAVRDPRRFAKGSSRRFLGAPAQASILLLIAATFPVGEFAALSTLFDVETFRLQGPVPMTLGRFIMVIGAVLALAAAVGPVRARLPAWLVTMALGVGLWRATVWFLDGLGPLGHADGRLSMIGFAVALTGLLTLVTAAALGLVRDSLRISAEPRKARGRLYFGVAGALFALATASGGAALVVYLAVLPEWWPALSALTGFAFVLALSGLAERGRFALLWASAAVVGGSAALPMVWSSALQSEIEDGADLLNVLEAVDEPDLEQSLRILAESADSLTATGLSEVEVMYGAWRASGLTRSRYPLRIAVNDPAGSSREELRIGVETEERHRELMALEEEAIATAAGGTRVFELSRYDAYYLVVRPLVNGAVLTVTAAALPAGSVRSTLGALVGGVPSSDGWPMAGASELVLIPPPLEARDSLADGRPCVSEPPNWARTETVWQVTRDLCFVDDLLHAHYRVAMPGALMIAARGTIVFLIGFVFLLAFWLIGRALAGELVPEGLSAGSLMRSFRARVTMALFGFFVLAVAIFGTLAYRTLNQAAVRSARVIAERVVSDAVASFAAVEAAPGQRIEALSRQVRAELLEYRGGELRGGGSVSELVELGLYEGWMPMREHLRLDGSEGVAGLTETSLGDWRYVTAYRRLPDGDILGAQVPFQAGTTAIRTTDLIELLAFALLVGALLSFSLAWLSGRALSSPMEELRKASEVVGKGDLAVRLPGERNDQFGVVFTAFNQMVKNLADARDALNRTTRRTQDIMNEASAGMVALDDDAHVILVNPSAGEILRREIRVGDPVPEDGELGEALGPWLRSFLAGDEDENTAELKDGERSVRVRARRFRSQSLDSRGVVVTLDDITDELRSARVLAWGTMARQVAHDVKNPLTPMKLAVQHLRRAWKRKDEEFEDILMRNVEVMLTEIESLATMAKSFRRFDVPGEDIGAPVAPVDAGDVVSEVVRLYGSGGSPITFRAVIPPDLPAVSARRDELKEVLANLLENSRRAVVEDGVIVVTARKFGGKVLIDVEDDGCGIPEAIQARIFEPRFSTRSGGSGLGLAIVSRIVTSWEGKVGVTSTEGEGAAVRLELKIWSEDA